MSGGHGGGRKHKGHDEEHENHERWLVTYADMLTLLMVLFIVMFAISQVDRKKFIALKSGLASGFGASTVSLTGSGTTIDETAGTDSPMDLASGVGGNVTKPADDQTIKDAAQAIDRAQEQRKQDAAKEEVEHLEQIKAQITQALDKTNSANDVKFVIDERGLVVTLVTSAVVFAGDRADLLPEGTRILDALGPALAPLPNRLEVDGHTNQLSMRTQYYPSGWELSSARASAVVRYLNEHAGIARDRLSAAGFADTRPLYPASDPRSVDLNRRVEIIVLSTLNAEERALLPSAVGEQ